MKENMMEIQLSENGLPFLDQFSEEGFVDCVFKIVSVQDKDNFYRLELRAVHENLIVGFNADVLKTIESGFDKDMNLIKGRTYFCGVKFHHSGLESDRLISSLAKLYGFNNPNLEMTLEETFTAICLQQGDVNLANDPVRLKLFGKDGEPFVEDDYYESFFNIDIPFGYAFWNEKDPDYRSPLLKGLTKPKLLN
jgi:hypothetical protein